MWLTYSRNQIHTTVYCISAVQNRTLIRDPHTDMQYVSPPRLHRPLASHPHARLTWAAAATMPDKKAGTVLPLSTRSHCTGTTPRSGGACGSTAACSAPRPCARPMRPNPDAASIATIRSAAAPRAAMPTSAHAPHCTLVVARASVCWHEA